MATRLIYALTIVIYLVLAVSADQETDTRGIVQKSDKFSVQFYKQASALRPSENLATAGSLVWILLSLLTLGDTGTSLTELRKALGLANDDEDFEARVLVPLVVDNIQKIKGIDLAEGSRFYIKDDGIFTTNDYDVDAHRYGVEVKPLPLDKPEYAARIVNTWVEETTNNRVKGLISAKDFGPSTSLVLINSVFIQPTWETAFDRSLTKPRPFHLLNGTAVNVDTMEATGRFQYGYTEKYDSKVLVVPLKGGEASVVFVVPTKKDGLPDLVKKLGANSTELIVSALELDEVSVKVRIPKVVIETTTNLEEILPKVGVSNIFRLGKSGLTYILDSGAEVVVTNAVQKAILVIDETGDKDFNDSLDLRGAFFELFYSRPEFFADHPYLAAVVPKDGPILYISQITNPAQ